MIIITINEINNLFEIINKNKLISLQDKSLELDYQGK